MIYILSNESIYCLNNYDWSTIQIVVNVITLLLLQAVPGSVPALVPDLGSLHWPEWMPLFLCLHTFELRELLFSDKESSETKRASHTVALIKTSLPEVRLTQAVTSLSLSAFTAKIKLRRNSSQPLIPSQTGFFIGANGFWLKLSTYMFLVSLSTSTVKRKIFTNMTVQIHWARPAACVCSNAALCKVRQEGVSQNRGSMCHWVNQLSVQPVYMLTAHDTDHMLFSVTAAAAVAVAVVVAAASLSHTQTIGWWINGPIVGWETTGPWSWVIGWWEDDSRSHWPDVSETSWRNVRMSYIGGIIITNEREHGGDEWRPFCPTPLLLGVLRFLKMKTWACHKTKSVSCDWDDFATLVFRFTEQANIAVFHQLLTNAKTLFTAAAVAALFVQDKQLPPLSCYCKVVM